MATTIVTENLTEATTITQDTPVATTSGTSASFTGIAAGIVKVEFDFANVSVNTDSLVQSMQIGDAGGLEATGYIAGAAGALLLNTSGADIDTTAFRWWMDYNKAVNTISGKITLTREESGSNTWILSGTLMCENQTATNTGGHTTVGGTKTLSGELTQVQFAISSGAFDNGSINATYYS